VRALMKMLMGLEWRGDYGGKVLGGKGREEML